MTHMCPECEERAAWTACGYVHDDGEPLCPVVGDSGYEPAEPVKTRD